MALDRDFMTRKYSYYISDKQLVHIKPDHTKTTTLEMLILLGHTDKSCFAVYDAIKKEHHIVYHIRKRPISSGIAKRVVEMYNNSNHYKK
ncbi:hypothetical protein C9E85_14705 [Plesiomonas shigelloides]|uniref:hypothetical protein n=1 Tax=Plesiomonas shigelloides TaxID=703 RepID=UPI000D5710B7|nr:hypothetical protein [Plesiomonas shigelloides]PVU65081.1 hypothetical protein C9E85_14705 [Plesiomonas shigelloides]